MGDKFINVVKLLILDKHLPLPQTAKGPTPPPHPDVKILVAARDLCWLFLINVLTPH